MEVLDRMIAALNGYLPLELIHSFLQKWPTSIPLNLIGLLFLADLPLIPHHTAQTGTAHFLDSLILVPGMHNQQTAPDLAKGEYPACAAMTTGYVFRVENQAMVLFCQGVGRSGCLTTLNVEERKGRGVSIPATLGYYFAILLTLICILLVMALRDWIGLSVLAIFILVRLVNAVVIRRRAKPEWFGAPEPGVKGDLLVLLSQDKWVRIQGLVDDLKAVTSGSWMRDMTAVESELTVGGTMLVYFSVALSFNAKQETKTLLLILLIGSTVLLGLVNHYTNTLQMHGRTVKVSKPPKAYRRRLELAEELINETGRKDWAIRMGMVQPDHKSEEEKDADGPPMM